MCFHEYSNNGYPKIHLETSLRPRSAIAPTTTPSRSITSSSSSSPTSVCLCLPGLQSKLNRSSRPDKGRRATEGDKADLRPSMLQALCARAAGETLQKAIAHFGAGNLWVLVTKVAQAASQRRRRSIHQYCAPGRLRPVGSDESGCGDPRISPAVARSLAAAAARRNWNAFLPGPRPGCHGCWRQSAALQLGGCLSTLTAPLTDFCVPVCASGELAPRRSESCCGCPLGHGACSAENQRCLRW